MELDRIDRHILNLLQRDNRITNAALAEKVGLSPPACLQRVKRLRASSLIRAEVALLEPKEVGHLLTMIMEVELERDRPDLYERFARSIRQAKEVTQCYQVTGEVDVVLVVFSFCNAECHTYQRFYEVSQPSLGISQVVSNSFGCATCMRKPV